MQQDATERTPLTRRRRILEAVALIVGSTIVIGVLSSIALLLYTEDSRQPTVHTLVIPAGAYDLIEQGENPLEIPPTWSFLADDTLVLDNQDDITHVLGAWTVPPNTIRSFELQPAYGGFFTCSLHPSGAITLNIEPRDYDFRLIAATTFGFGLSVGLVLWIGISVSRAMGGSHGDPYRRDELPSNGGDDRESEALGI